MDSNEWNEDLTLRQFTREFLSHGENHLSSFLIANSVEGELLVTKLFENLTFGTSLVHSVIIECLKLEREEKINHNLDLPLEKTIQLAATRVYKKEFQKLLITSAVEIFFSFVRQFQFIFRKVDQNQLDRAQAVQILAQFCSKVSMKNLISSQSIKYPHSAVIFKDDRLSRNVEEMLEMEPIVLPTYAETIEDQLILMWADRSKMVSKIKFFQWPIIALNVHASHDPFKSVEANTKIFVKKEDFDAFQGDNNQFCRLRSPMDFEWNQVQNLLETENLVEIPVDKMSEASSLPLEWKDQTELINKLLDEIEIPVQTDHLYETIGQLVVQTNQKLVKKMEFVLTNEMKNYPSGLELDTSRQNELVLKIQNEVLGGGSPSKLGLVIKSTGIRFNVKDPIASFTGRTEFLEQLYNELHSPNNNGPTEPQLDTGAGEDVALTHLRVITGLGGIGKSGVARKYIKEFGHNYHHIIWIEAETTECMIQNFRTIAEQNLKIPTKTVHTEVRCPLWDKEKNCKIVNEIWPSSLNPKLPSGNAILSKSSETHWRPLDEMLAEIYEIICQYPSLFIFDNAETFLDNEIGQSSGIAPFLPPHLSCKLIKPKIIVTSQNPIWNTIPSKLIPLAPLSKAESVSLILNNLHLDQDCPKLELADDLADLMDGLPLLLQLSTTSIYKFVDQKSVEPTTALSQYITDYKVGLESPEFLRYLQTFTGSLSVYLTLLLSFDRIEKMDQGPMSIKILKHCAYLCTSEIPKDCLYAFFPGKDTFVDESLSILIQFCLIKISSDSTIRTHEQIQEVVLDKLKEDQEFEGFTKRIVKRLTHFISSKSPSYNLYRATLTNALRIISHLLPKLHEDIDIQKFVHFIADRIVDIEINMHSKALQLYTALYDLEFQSHGPSDPKSLELEFKIAQCHLFLADHKKALDKFNSVYDAQRRILGDNDESVLKTLCEIAKLKGFMNHGHGQGQMDNVSSLRLLDECFEKQKQILPQYHPEALQILHRKAIILHSLKRYEESLNIFQLLLEKEGAIHGSNSFQVLTIQNDMAALLTSKGDHDGAHTLLQNVLEKRMDMIGIDHPLIFTTLWQILRLYESQGKFEMALEVVRDLWQVKKEIFGNDDRRVLIAEQDIACILCCQKNYQQSFVLCEKILEKQRNLLGENHIDVLTTLYNMGTIEYLQNNYLQAFNLYRAVHEKFKEILGHQKSLMLVTMIAMAKASSGLGKYSEALDLYTECCEERSQILGPRHPETLLVYCEMSDLYRLQKKFSHALILLHKIYKLQIEDLGVDKPESLMTAIEIGRVYLDLDKFEEAFEFLSLLQKNLVKLLDKEKDKNEFYQADVGLGIIYLVQQRYDDALASFGRVFEAGKLKFGQFDKNVLNDQSLLSLVYKGQENYSRALGIVKDVHKKQCDTLGEGHVDTLYTTFKMAHIYQLKEDYEKALELYRLVWHKMGQMFDEEHSIVMEAEESIGTNLEKLDRYDEALKVYDNIYETRKSKLGQCHPDTLQIQFLKVIVFVSQKKFEMAQSLLQQVYKLQVENLGKGHVDTLSTKEKIDAIQEYMEDKKKKGCGCSIT